MAVKLYVGYPGSGKSYEVVTEVIAEALKLGRRVVTNVDGVKADRIREDLASPDHPPEEFGELVRVDNDEIAKPDFFCTADSSGFVRPGDLVVIDECWRFWPARVKYSPKQLEFFREHRHYAHPETGVTCDLVLITQLVEDVDSKLRGIVEMTCRMQKLKEMGLNEWYTVEIFNCAPRGRTKPLRVLKRKYDKSKFEWYSSYKGKGEEQEVDGRQNVFKGWFFKVMLPLAVLFVIGGFWFAKGYFSKAEKPPESAQAPKDGKEAKPATPAAPPKPDVSDRWKAQGYMMTSSGVSVYLTDGDDSRIAVNPPAWFLAGRQVNLKVENEWVTQWSGSSSSRSPLLHP